MLTSYTKERVYHQSIELLKKQLTDANETIRQLRRELSIAKKDNSYRDDRSWAELDMEDYHGRSD